MFRHLAITGPEHVLTANPFLPDDPGTGGGGTGGAGGAPGAGGTGGGTTDGGPAGGVGGQQTPPQQTGSDQTDWKSHARQWETKAKADAKRAEELAAEVERLKAASMSDAEKAIEAAKAEGQKLGLAAGVGEAVAARLEAALSHLPDAQRDALIDSVSRDRFVGSDGKPDRAAIKAWAEQVAPKPDPKNGFPPLGQGQRTTPPATSMSALIRQKAGLG